MFGSNKGEEDLAFGIRAYEDGELAYSGKLLQASLDEGLSFKSDRVRAHKYLAFIHCVLGLGSRPVYNEKGRAFVCSGR